MYPASSAHSAPDAASSNYESGKDATSTDYEANSRGHLGYLVESQGRTNNHVRHFRLATCSVSLVS